MKIGIDVGGTHTDGVLIENTRILKSVKVKTQDPIIDGIAHVLSKFNADASHIVIGTTKATNAILEGKNLAKVGLIRLSGKHGACYPPGSFWPEHLLQAIDLEWESVSGGYECDGREISPLKDAECRSAIYQLLQKGVQSFAIAGIFSPLIPNQEKMVANLIQDIAGKDFPVTLSSSIGGMGLIERENGAIFNAALIPVMARDFALLEKLKDDLNIRCPMYLSQNNGSLLHIEDAIAHPILTIASGPTNSHIGACRLSHLSDAIIVDVGGTSTDIGLVLNGYPIRSLNQTSLGGVRLNFHAPDLISLPVGGGSHVAQNLQVGPKSFGRDLKSHACIFGGNDLTLTDLACVAGHLHIERADPSNVRIKKEVATKVLLDLKLKLNQSIQKMRGKHHHLPVIFVGGAAPIFGETLPSNYAVANAYGAALSEMAVTLDRMVCMKDRENTLSQLEAEAKRQALEKGAKGEIRKVNLQIIPYNYFKDPLARVILTVSGAI